MAIALAAACNGCNKASAPANQTSPNLKPVSGAFGYFLGSNGVSIVSEPVEDVPPFNSVSVDVLSKGKICSIQAIGFLPDYQLSNTESNLVAALGEKYGLRDRNLCQTPMPDERDYNFGTIADTAKLRVIPGADKMTFILDYTDERLQQEYFDEMRSNQLGNDHNQMTNLSKNL